MKDPLAEALLSAEKGRRYRMKLEVLFGDRPEVLEALREMKRRGHSYRSMARALSAHLENDSVSPNAVMNWFEKDGAYD